MHGRLTRRGALGVAALALAGCLDSRVDGPAATDPANVDLLEDVDSTPARAFDGGEPDDLDPAPVTGDVPVAAETLPLEYELAALRDAVESGGVPKDGIPSIDDPVYADASAVDNRFDDGDPMFGLVVGDEAVAYPQSILVYHEIVNDEIGGLDVCVTYCPLTGTAMGFESGGVEFGVSGNLLNSNLVMYDRETDSDWPQMLATAIDGEYEGHSLREVPVRWTTWGNWVDTHPDSNVLTDDTGYVRDYRSDPYGAYNPLGGYYRLDADPIFAPLRADDRLPPKRMVLGARPPEGPLAVDRERLVNDGLVDVESRDSRYLAVSDPDFDTGHLYLNPEDQSFSRDDGSVFDEDGESYDPAELPLDRVYAYDAMWFAWFGFYPSTTLHV